MAAFSRLGSGRYGVRRAGIFSRSTVAGSGEAVGHGSAVAEVGNLIVASAGVSVGCGHATADDKTSTRGAVPYFSRLSTGRWGMRRTGSFVGRGSVNVVEQAGVSIGGGYVAAVTDTVTPRGLAPYSKLGSGRWPVGLPGSFAGRGSNVTVTMDGVAWGGSVVVGDFSSGDRTIPKRTRMLVSGWGSRLTGVMERGATTYVVGAGTVSAGGVVIATGLLQSNIVSAGAIGAKGRAGVTGNLVVLGAPFDLGSVTVGAKARAGVAGTLSVGDIFTLGFVSVGAKGKAGVAASDLTANNPFDLGIVTVGAKGKATITGDVAPAAAFELGVVSVGALGRAGVVGRFFGEPWVSVDKTQTGSWTPVVKG